MKIAAALLFLISLGSKVFAAESCQRQELEFIDGEFRVQTLRYKNASSNSNTIIIVPPTGGTNFLDKSYAKALCKQGFQVLILAHWSDDDEYSLDLKIHQRFYERVQKAIGLILKNNQSETFGILGTSVGAIHAAVAVHHYSEIRTAFLIAGGAPIAEVIANTDQQVLAEAREKRFATMGFKTQQEYISALSEVLPMEPFKSPKVDLAKQLAMVIVPNDTVVPGANQRDLERLWNPNWKKELSGNHTFAIIKMWLFYQSEVIDFFKQSMSKK